MILIGAFIFGIGPGIAMAAIKDLIHVMQTQTAGTGELQDFILTCTLIVVAVTFYRFHKSRKGALIGCAAGAIAMSLVCHGHEQAHHFAVLCQGHGMEPGYDF